MASAAAADKMAESTTARAPPPIPNHRDATAPLFCEPALAAAFEPAPPGSTIIRRELKPMIAR
jgi:hypothetical protein